jgi:TRAP-type C4-dicarboxylate transport system substrate-binding protein
MIRRFLLSALVLFAALAIPGSAAPPEANAQQAVTIRIATLAPRGSTWMRVFNAWNADLRRRTQNQVSIRFYPGGVSGDERDFIRKINAGQMDGAAVTTTGLGQVVRPVLVLGVPGLIEEYRQIDRVREQLRGEFDTMFEGAGFVNLGWGDVGKARLFSQAPIRRPQDMRSMRPWAWRDDMIFTEFLRVVGANGVRLGVPEVYPALQTGQVNVVPASALAAVSLQWHTRLTHVTQQNSGVIVGATIVKKSVFDALTADQQTALRETSQRAHDLLLRSIRRDDDRAYATILERGTTQIDTTPAQAEWDRAAEQTRQRLTGRVYPADLLQRVQQAAGN